VPISVLFDRPLPGIDPEELTRRLESVGCKTFERWDVVFTPDPGEGDGNWSMTITGPDHHRRVFRIDPGDGRASPPCLAALLRSEIRCFPSCPPHDYSRALAELTRKQIPYDDTGAFGGRVEVAGVRVTMDQLVDLYRRNRLDMPSILQGNRTPAR
jgi:hypothetical protein